MKHVVATVVAMVVSGGIALAQTSPPTGTPTGPATPPAGMPGTPQSANSAKAQIEASGYTNVKDLKRQEDGSWQARATKNNEEVAVMVDGTGNVTQMSQ
jgi:hypothetical protein